MTNAFFKVPEVKNEPINSYAPGSPEREKLQGMLRKLKSEKADIPMYIGGKEIRTENKISLHPPHETAHTLGHYHRGGKEHVSQAVDAALEARKKWACMPWKDRAAIFLKAADLISGPYRDKINAATMLGQSKNAFQAEIDSACELIDFFRFNVQFMQEIYEEQPNSAPNTWNMMEYRPLEGFIFAITPFNFTAISGNLPGAPVLMGNVAVWKPADTQIYAASVVMEILIEAGLPDGVINLVYADGPDAGDVVFEHPDFSGLHFTGSTKVFQNLWKIIGNNIEKYKSYPRIVGETGGKDFIIAHSSADAKALSTAIARGAFEFQGQKCSAASRVYMPDNLWPSVKESLIKDISSFKVGSPEDFSNFINAVIDEAAFDKITGSIEKAREADDAEIIAGGQYDKSEGYFIEPTVVLTENPKFITMEEEIFGPVVTIYVYDKNKFEETLELLDETSPYALTGAIFSKDRYMAELATRRLVNSAGNFYINDKPTGAVVGQQPFGGARKSGTNDKAGAKQNLLRWVSTRAIKENFLSPKDYRYPFLGEE